MVSSIDMGDISMQIEPDPDDEHIMEHKALRRKLVESMFRLDDFLLWKQRGLSDAEAHDNVQDRFDYGFVVWKDGLLQYIEDPDSEFDADPDSDFKS